MNRTVMTALVGSVAAVTLGSLLTVTVLTSTAAARSTTAHPSASSSPAVVPSPAAAPVAAAPPRVLVIGDSIMNGFGLTPGDAWPELVSSANGWDLTSRACDGAGFLAPGSPDECGDSFGDVIRSAAVADPALHPALQPDLIIIEGSSNDFGQSNSELLSATLNALTLARSEFPEADIVGLSTLWSETEPPTQLADINSQVQQAVTAVGGHYLDIGQPLGEHPELMQDDDVHPTAAGQQVLATAIQAAITVEQQATAEEQKLTQK